MSFNSDKYDFSDSQTSNFCKSSGSNHGEKGFVMVNCVARQMFHNRRGRLAELALSLSRHNGR